MTIIIYTIKLEFGVHKTSWLLLLKSWHLGLLPSPTLPLDLLCGMTIMLSSIVMRDF